MQNAGAVLAGIPSARAAGVRTPTPEVSAPSVGLVPRTFSRSLRGLSALIGGRSLKVLGGVEQAISYNISDKISN